MDFALATSFYANIICDVDMNLILWTIVLGLARLVFDRQFLWTAPLLLLLGLLVQRIHFRLQHMSAILQRYQPVPTLVTHSNRMRFFCLSEQIQIVEGEAAQPNELGAVTFDILRGCKRPFGID